MPSRTQASPGIKPEAGSGRAPELGRGYPLGHLLSDGRLQETTRTPSVLRSKSNWVAALIVSRIGGSSSPYSHCNKHTMQPRLHPAWPTVVLRRPASSAHWHFGLISSLDHWSLGGATRGPLERPPAPHSPSPNIQQLLRERVSQQRMVAREKSEEGMIAKPPCCLC